MKTHSREVELKFAFDPAAEGRLKRHLSHTGPGKRLTSETLVSVYFDTPDFRLQAKGISLRVRRVGKKYRQTIKVADRAGTFDRAEWEKEIGGPAPDLATAKASAVADVLSGQLWKALQPVFETRVRRTRYRFASHGQRVELAIDRGEIDTGKCQLPICELELELLHGDRESLFTLAKALNHVVPLRLCVKAKADRGYELVRGDIDPVDKATDVHLSPEMTTQEAFRHIGDGCLRQLIANESAMIAGDAEALHQMRVALRRLRAAISAFSNVVADNDWRGIRSELRWITGELGPARDLDVFIAEVLEPLGAQNPKEPGVLGIVHDFKRRRARAHKEIVATIQSARFRTLLLNTAEWIEVGPWTKSSDDLLRLLREKPVVVLATDELTRRRKKLKRKNSTTLKELSPLQRHELRIAAKKFRYALEFFSDLFPGKPRAKRCSEALSALKDMQDALGALNDIAVRERLASRIALSRRVKSDALGLRRRAFAAGLIFGSQEAQTAALIEAAESAYAKFLDVKAFWK